MMRNQSGYPDPTAEAAIEHVLAEQHSQERRPLVYICVPCGGNFAGNTRKARVYSKFAVKQQKTPIAPQLFFPQILGKVETAGTRKIARQMEKQIIRKCRELWWFGKEPTEGMKEEIRIAMWEGLIVKHFNEGCEEVA